MEEVRSKICVCTLGECVVTIADNLTDNDCMNCPFNKVMTNDEAERFIAWCTKHYKNKEHDDYAVERI